MFSAARKAQRFLLKAGLCVAASFCVQGYSQAFAKDSSIVSAADGLDVVELSFGRHVSGETDFSYVFAGKNWIFANPHNLAMFVSDPFDFMGDDYNDVAAPDEPLSDDAKLTALLKGPKTTAVDSFTAVSGSYDEDAVILDGVTLPEHTVDLAHQIEADLVASAHKSKSAHH